jgi:hypothetical protein
MTDDEVPEARSRDLAVRVVWEAKDGGLDGGLDGYVEVRNVGDHVVRVDGKPLIRPLGADGKPLDAQHIVTAELRVPSYVDLQPGESATSRIGWAGWDGAPASGEVLVEWGSRGPERTARVAVEGPPQPPSPGPVRNLYSSWFVAARPG